MLSRCRFAGLSLARSAGARTASTMPAFPNAAVAKSMTRHMSEVSGENLFILAGAGNQDAIRERVRREIMAKDGVEYEETTVRLQEMSAVACANHHFYMFPFQVGIVSAGVSGVLSLPLVFSYRCASWFNDIFVTADPPEVHARRACLARAPARRNRSAPRAHAEPRRRPLCSPLNTRPGAII